MNTIYYANPKTGKRAAVKIGQPSYAKIIGTHPGIRNNKQRLRPTMAEADETMRLKGFVRWPRKKPLPSEKLKAAA